VKKSAGKAAFMAIFISTKEFTNLNKEFGISKLFQ